jgi:hypothetical protein
MGEGLLSTIYSIDLHTTSLLIDDRKFLMLRLSVEVSIEVEELRALETTTAHHASRLL